MSSKTEHLSARQSLWQLCCRHPLLLKIVVWLGSLSFVGSAGLAGANVMPVSTATVPWQSIDQFNSFTPLPTAATTEVTAAELETANYFRASALLQSPLPVDPAPPTPKVSPVVAAAAARLVPTRPFIRPQHLDLLTADNYLVWVNESDLRPKTATAASPAIVPDRAQEVAQMTASRIAPISTPAAIVAPVSGREPRSVAATNLRSNSPAAPANTDRIATTKLGKSPPARTQRSRQSISPKCRSSAGLSSRIVTPMKPRLSTCKPRDRSPLKSPTKLTSASARSTANKAVQPLAPTPPVPTQPIEILSVDLLSQLTPHQSAPTTPNIRSRLSFSQPQPMVAHNTGTTRSPANPTATTTQWQQERLATISNLKITDPSFQQNSAAAPDLPKQKIALAPNTQLTVGVKVLEAKDLTDTIDPLFDRVNNNEESMISRFGTRAGLYNLVAGSGVGIRHKFSPTLEASVGVLVKSVDESNQNNKSSSSSRNGGSGNSKSNSATVDGSDNGLLGGASLSNSYGTIAQLTYAPSQNTKIGLTYVYGYNVYPEIGSASANQTDGGTSALGLQTFMQLQPNLALGGRIGFHQNSNTEFNKNIFTWSLTAAIPDLGGKGNLAGIVIGQEPRVIGASNLDVQDSGSGLHLEGFYQIKISNDFSITPALIYLAGPNIDHANAESDSITGAIGITYKF